MPAYADFNFYMTNYLGTILSSVEFPRLSMRASAIIDHLTFGRAKGVIEEAIDLETIEKIKLAVCGVAESINRLDKTENNGIGEVASERVGQHSVSYVQGNESRMTKEDRYIRVAKLYLWDTGLMYAGVD